jgi:hypothetical protein
LLVFVPLVMTGKIEQKDAFVGKEALDTYVGSQKYTTYLFYYRLAGMYALQDAVASHANLGGVDHESDCATPDYGIWFSEDCSFDSSLVQDSFVGFFDDAFHRQLGRVFVPLEHEITLPFEYFYALDDDSFTITSEKNFMYYAYDRTYSLPVTLTLNSPSLQDYLDVYQILFDSVVAASPCLGSEDVSSCFVDTTFAWTVTQQDNLLLFTVVPEDLEDIEISFAISLNMLDQLESPYTELFPNEGA